LAIPSRWLLDSLGRRAGNMTGFHLLRSARWWEMVQLLKEVVAGYRLHQPDLQS